MKDTIAAAVQESLLERFLRYVAMDTRSDPHAEGIPSTPGQWDLLRLLEAELKELGIGEVELDDKGYLIARVPGNRSDAPWIGLMAHVDTSHEVSGAGVQPRIYRNYDASVLPLEGGYRLDPREYPELLQAKGKTVITTDGTTLLGADDKAGVAEIMTALAWLLAHPEQPRPGLEIIFTPDEETGKGLSAFDPQKLRSKWCYTVDGSEEGTIEAECFNAARAEVTFTGKVIHLGTARGSLINAVTMAASYVSLLPRNESPEATDGRYGYYTPMEISGDLEKARVEVFLRDFEAPGMERRKRALEDFARAVEASFPGGKVEMEIQDMYRNMRDHIAGEPKIMELLEEAIRRAGFAPVRQIIRGGTDGARLSEMGIPTPNIFTGGHNYHSRFEWACLETMTGACETLVHLAGLWADAS